MRRSQNGIEKHQEADHKNRWLVVKCLPNNDLECTVEEGDALEVAGRQEHSWNEVALIPLDKVLDAIIIYQNTLNSKKNTTENILNKC